MPRTQHAPLRLPAGFRKRLGASSERRAVAALMRKTKLNTVCEEAKCPNIGECFQSGTATFMILGDTCTRRCHFCAVKTGRPQVVDPGEPDRLVAAVEELGLSHVVLTSVDRDELPDYGAAHWATCIRAIKEAHPHVAVEILTPDFKGDKRAIDVVLAAGPDVFNHNIETVERLYKKVRPQSNWQVTTGLLKYIAEAGHPAVKSGLMVGLGETDSEVEETLALLAELGVHIATIGQYLRPSMTQWPVSRYVEDAQYDAWRAHGLGLGIAHVFAGPFVRSSYHAKEAHAALPKTPGRAPRGSTSRRARRGLPILTEVEVP